MTMQVNENRPATIIDDSLRVSRPKNSDDVAIDVCAGVVMQVVDDFSANRFTVQGELSLRLSKETAQSLYDELFLMGFRFSGTGEQLSDPPALKAQPVVAESTPSSTKIRGINPECCGPWFVESSDEHA
jgi:hypothetical protein